MAALVFRTFSPAFSRTWLALSLALGLAGCAAPLDLPLGKLSVELSSGSGQHYYRLSEATIAIEGDRSLTLSSEESPESEIEATLPVGDYTAELLPGWRLLEYSGADAAPVEAELVSSNPVSFEIRQDQRARVLLEFATGEAAEAEARSEGQLRVGIAVDGAQAPRLVITELMRNPQALSDSVGEWIELLNAGDEPFDLSTCALQRGRQSFTFDQNLVVPAGEYLTLANGEAPGFAPDAVYRGLALPNSGAFAVELRCGEQLLDAVTVDSAQAEDGPGVSLSLSPARFDAFDNDDPASWCAASTSYNGDLGSPGRENPPCVDALL